MACTTKRSRLLVMLGRVEARIRIRRRCGDRVARAVSVRSVAAAARAGVPQAQSMLGLLYLRGHGVPASPTEARHWLECAAAAGDITARTALASLALRGVAGPYQRGLFAPPTQAEPDGFLAAELARPAADAGSAEAQAILAYVLRQSPQIATAPDEADTLYLRSAKAGWPLGQLGHALTLLREGTPDHAREALDLLRAAAKAGLPAAHFLLGAMAEAGAGQAPDAAKAIDHYRGAAERGHVGGKFRLGLAQIAGRGCEPNLVEGETWLRRAALDGDALSAAVLGDFHASTDRKPPDMAQAARWYRLAAEQGHGGAARALARALRAGAEHEPDPREIATLLQTAIERGEQAAWPDLGRLMASSALPSDQLPTLHRWLQRMMREDRPEAGYYVGVCVNCGIGTPADEPLARRYYLWAASQGVIEAMVAAAEMLLNGRGGPPDRGLARALFGYAAGRDHAGALYALGVIEGNSRGSAMTYFQRAAALGHVKAKALTEAMPIAA